MTNSSILVRPECEVFPRNSSYSQLFSHFLLYPNFDTGFFLLLMGPFKRFKPQFVLKVFFCFFQSCYILWTIALYKDIISVNPQTIMSFVTVPIQVDRFYFFKLVSTSISITLVVHNGTISNFSYITWLYSLSLSSFLNYLLSLTQIYLKICIPEIWLQKHKTCNLLAAQHYIPYIITGLIANYKKTL